jgi:hypothetical protein
MADQGRKSLICNDVSFSKYIFEPVGREFESGEDGASAARRERILA